MTNSLSISLRALEPLDVELLYKWENDAEVWRVSGTILPYSRHTLKKYVESSYIDIYESKQLRLMIECNGCAVGSVDIFDFDPHNMHAGVGIIIFDKEDRGKGIASRALEILEEYCFKTLSLHQIYCNITTSNIASLNLFASRGFETIGVKKEWRRIDGVFCDEVMVQKISNI